MHIIVLILLIIGGLNWGLYGAFGWELGQNLLGGMTSALSKIVYVLVGLAAVWEIFTHKKNCRACEKSASAAPASPAPGM